ncbi:hypothetical protein JQ634_24505 [Bradyrhizobium sp. AUGA SZCCT0240]|uniref:hypothetical protein n=1 Tax=unclassified Bradyrhizobium TaxID=2631580 RepID=UPI001BA4A5EF|nr:MULTISPECIES: hypothetical protein [unclassified Bradyrhizobium]MBR1195375.1 hypothetical protein [Bradyrhizobium sp. AUGA SZCCT0158]MBR1242220.1 hypothetical protein [Bradyrhizobium sp. AUGA SZCCT0274]MBR1249841.1 hypothetical protein [Bradyrhizobium sp. AUGA SZCCT0169]MBR1256859.1 hypothetical protein [Bradyrhizobium sp. AUGA SZCCT0240]
MPFDRERHFAFNRNALTAIPPTGKKTRLAAAGSIPRHSNAQGGAFLCGAHKRPNSRQSVKLLILLAESLRQSWHAFCIEGNIDRH